MKKVVFTNGCFDILHAGHIDLLERAKMLGTYLIVGINSDESVKKIKGLDRPFVNQFERKAVLQALKSVDEVQIFDELTPENMIAEIQPDVLIKGGDWKENEIIGAEFVKSIGGEVFSLPLKEGFSSTNIVEKIRNSNRVEQSLSNPTLLKENVAGNLLESRINIYQEILREKSQVIIDCAEIISNTISENKKIILCEVDFHSVNAKYLADRFNYLSENQKFRFPIIALHYEAISNTKESDKLYFDKLNELTSPGDCLIAIDSEGKTQNVINAVMTARNLGCKVIGLTGSKGKKIASLCDSCFMIPSDQIDIIRETYVAVGNIWCQIIESKLN